MYFLFSWRYFKAKKSTNAINIIAWISTMAIAVGALALVLVLSVFNGFESLVKSLYSSFYTDLKIEPAQGKVLVLTKDQLAKLRRVPYVKDLSCVAEEKAILQNANQQQKVVFLKGVDAHFADITGVKEHIVRGQYDLGTVDTPFIILGAGVEAALGLETDRTVYQVTAYLPKAHAPQGDDPMASISEGNLSPVGTFGIQQDFDDKYVLTNLAAAKLLLGLGPDEYSSVELEVTDQGRIEEARKYLQAFLGPGFKVLTRYEENKSLYTVMRTEKWVIFFVLVLILSIAAFNMVGSLTMLVLEKQKDIHILKALGAEDGFIRRIFLGEGVVIAGMGTFLGVSLALLLCWAQVHFKLIPLEGGSFVIDYYPVKVIPGDIMVVVGTIFVVALAASWYPARKASLEQVDLRS